MTLVQSTIRTSPQFRQFSTPAAMVQPENLILAVDHFTEFDSVATTGRYTVTQATTGTAGIKAGAHGGLLEIAAGAATAGQGINIQGKSWLVPQAGIPIHVEALLNFIVSPATLQFFFGLSEIDTSVIASGENSSANHVGFELSASSQSSSPRTLQLVSEKASVRVNPVAAGPTIPVDGGWFKLGVTINGLSEAVWYANDVEVHRIKNSAYIPAVALAPTLVVQANGTAEPRVEVDYLKIGTYRTYGTIDIDARLQVINP